MNANVVLALARRDMLSVWCTYVYVLRMCPLRVWAPVVREWS